MESGLPLFFTASLCGLFERRFIFFDQSVTLIFMKTLYAIASRFAGPGIGRAASHAALGLWRANALSRLVCLGHEPTQIEPTITRDVWFPTKRFLRFFDDKTYYGWKNRWFDRRLLAHVTDSFDTIHAWNSQATGALEKAKQRGVKIVLDRASSHILTQTKILTEQYAKHGIDFVPTNVPVIERCRRDYELADIVVTPSPFAYQSFIDRGFDKDRLVLNPFGVDLSQFTPSTEAPENFTAIFVGQVGIRKGAPTLLQAWDTLGLPDAKLVLVGPIEPAAKPLLKKWQGRTDIEFAGPVNNVPERLRQGSVFVFGSCEEGSALVTYEAMACGLPVIATYNSGSIVTDQSSGYIVDADKPEQLAEKIETLYRDRDRAFEMGRNGRKQVEGYPWQNYGDRTALLHQGLHDGKTAAQIQADLNALLF
jgi:glycosyltransferase involved in cell wall biosynthesis